MRRAQDLMQAAENKSCPQFTCFLSEEESASLAAVLPKFSRYSLFGGYEGAARTVMAFLPDWAEKGGIEYPISPLTFIFREEDKLSHRDFLGTFMSLGIKRETVGDILIESGRAVAFFKKEIAGFVAQQITKVGGCGVQIINGFTQPLPSIGKKQPVSCTVASMRLDSVLAALINTSRSVAEGMLCDGLVSVNSVLSEKATRAIKAGDKISVRGYGKYEIISCGDFSKKGRIILKAEKYI